MDIFYFQDQKQPHPLPMPEYGGWFAPMTEFLPEASSPIQSFHRCNLAAILITDLVRVLKKRKYLYKCTNCTLLKEEKFISI